MRLGPSLLLTVLLAAPAAGQHRHAHPERDAEVPVDGAPTWVEDLTVGSPVSDFGSHAGMKAAVRTDGVVPARAFLNQAHYGAFGSVAAQTDQVLVWLEDVTTGRAVLAPPDDRRVSFHSWGWEETAVQGDLRAYGAVTTLATDAFLVVVRVENLGRVARTLAPRLGVVADGDGAHESMQPLHLSWMMHRGASVDRGRNAAILEHRRGTPLDPFAWDRLRLVRAIGADVPLLRVRDGLTGFPGASRWARTFEAAPLHLPAGGTLKLSFVVGCGEDRAEAERNLARGRTTAGPDAGLALARVRADWDAALARLPRPHAASPDEERLYRIAYTGLRHNRFAKRGRMQGDCATAAKVHFNTFFVWDVALHAWAEREWDPAGAREVLLTLFRAQRPDGHLHYTVGPDLQPAVSAIEGTSQGPVHGWVLEKVLERGADPAFLSEVYDRSGRWLDWFERKRDADRDGLPGFGSALETGWDDTPRYPGLHPAPVLSFFGLEVHLGNLSGLLPVDDIDALDLACWIHAYYRAMSRFAETLGKPRAEVDAWRAKATALAARIEARLWDPVSRSYRDMRVGSSGLVTPVRADTPVIAWPLFLGVTRDLDRARATIESHLLDARRFMGDPDDPARPFLPMPSVAYDDPDYDHATDGYYWRGQVWLLPGYAACEALFKYGWEAESRELRRRLLRGVLRAHGNGIHETYDARSDRIGFGSGSLTGAGEPAAFLIGLSCAPVVELLLDRQERERFVTPRDARFEGFVAEARALGDDALFYRARAASGHEVPRVTLSARAGLLIPGPGATPLEPTLELTLDDPHGNLPAGPIALELPSLAGYAAWGIDAAGRALRLPAGTGPGLTLSVELTSAGGGAFTRYVLVPAGGAP